MSVPDSIAALRGGAMPGPALVCYLKPSNFCGVGCAHCYLPVAVRADRRVLSRDLFAPLRRFLREFAVRTRAHRVDIVYHGGEPLSVPVSWYRDFGLRVVEPLRGDGVAVRELMQTSLIPFAQRHIAFVHERLGGQLGISVDFSAHRSVRGSNAAYRDRLLARIARARAGGIMLSPSFVPSVDELGRGAWILDWLAAHAFSHCALDRYNAWQGADPRRPGNRDHARFLVELLDASLERLAGDRPVVRIAAVVAGVAGVLDGRSGDRWGGACQSHFVVVEPDGGLNTCPDRSAVDPPFSRLHDGFGAFACAAVRRRWVRYQGVVHRHGACARCVHREWCRGGCPITAHGDPDGDSRAHCAGYSPFLDHVRARAAEPGVRALLVRYAGAAAVMA